MSNSMSVQAKPPSYYPEVRVIPMHPQNTITSSCVKNLACPKHLEYTCLTYDPGKHQFEFFKDAIPMTSSEESTSAFKAHTFVALEAALIMAIPYFAACAILEIPLLVSVLITEAIFVSILGVGAYLSHNRQLDHETLISRTFDQIATFLDSEFSLDSSSDHNFEVVVLENDGQRLFQSIIEEMVNKNEPSQVLFIGNYSPPFLF